MILSDVTSGNRIGTSNIAANEQTMPVVGRNGSQVTLSSLKVGDSIQAKVVSRDGDNVRLQVDGNKYIDARMSSGINVEAGKDIIFEVRSTSSGITLSPLFTNTSSDPNISKALSMAGLPLNSDTITMTKNMMQAGMSIDRVSLTNMFKDISLFSHADVNDIVDLHRLGIEVNEDNIEQISSYKNISYQLGEGLNDVAGKLTELVDNLVSQSDGLNTDKSLTNAAKLFSSVITVSEEYDWKSFGDAEVIAKEASMANENGELTTSIDELSPLEKALRLIDAKANGIDDESKDTATVTEGKGLNLSNVNVVSLRNEMLALFDDIKNQYAGNEDYSRFKNILSNSDSSTVDLLNVLKESLDKAVLDGDTKTLGKIMNNAVIRENVFAAMKAQWNITPDDVADKNNVKEMYARLQRQMGLINETIESVGFKQSDAGNAAGNMGNNLDFLNQVNQMYAYIQLPLKLSTGDNAHGDLYVYSNGKKLSSNDGKVTALLHLDMEHLGPLDVYVAMDTSGLDKKVTTQFTVADEDVLDFLSLHMDELTKRLEAKGYSCNARMSVKGTDIDEDEKISSEKRGIGPVLDMTGNMKLAEYSFDVRT